MKCKTKQTLRAMIEALESFESHKVSDKIDHKDWIDLNSFLADKNLHTTWMKIIAFKASLKEFIGQWW